jgi:hypothetical protein
VPAYSDRVQETTTTTGTGTVTLAGAVTGYQSFATAFPAALTPNIPYTITDSAGNWETGIGTYTLSGTTLTRSVTQSSNANNLVSFGAGTKNVFLSSISAVQRNFTYGTVAPTSPNVGDEWFDSTVGAKFVWLNDGSSTQWVEC